MRGTPSLLSLLACLAVAWSCPLSAAEPEPGAADGEGGDSVTDESASGQEDEPARPERFEDTPFLGEPLNYLLPGSRRIPMVPVEELSIPADEHDERDPAAEPEVIEFEQKEPAERERWESDDAGQVVLEAESPPEDEEDGPDGEEDKERRYRVPGPCGEWEGGELAWYDRTHGMVSRTLCWPSRWFDNFFGDPDEVDQHRAGTYVRLTGAQAWQDDGENPDRFSYSASVNLPRIQERLSLVFSDDDADREETLLRRAREEEEEPESVTRAGLRYVLRAREAMDLDTDAGVRGSRLKAFVRVRYRERWPITEHWHFSLGEEITWRDTRGWESVSRLGFNRALGGRAALRVTTRAEWSQEDFDVDGWYWRQRAAVGVQLTSRSAIDYSITVDGYTRPHAQVENYRLGTRFRRNFWRPWMFYEIEPFVRWSLERDHEPVHGIWFRLEARFGLYD